MSNKIQLYTESVNRMISDILNRLKNIKEPISKETFERVFNKAVQAREMLRGAVIGYNILSQNKVKLVENELLLEVKMFDTNDYECLKSEKIYKYSISSEI